MLRNSGAPQRGSAATLSSGPGWWAIALVLLIASSCKRNTEIVGIGTWNLTTSTLADATDGRCQPTDLPDGRKGTWCFALKPFLIAGKTADLDTYFESTEPTARLVELQLKLRLCDEEATLSWLRARLGSPATARASRAYWQTSSIFVAAMVPLDPKDRGGACLIRMLPLSEQAEIDRIKLL